MYPCLIWGILWLVKKTGTSMYKYFGFALFVFGFYACVPTYEKVHEENLRQVDPKTIDLLRGFHGEMVRSSDDWEKWRRPEILSYYERF
jgi:hypothetical protein